MPLSAERLRSWARAHVPELAMLGVGILLRLSMALTYDARIGYDFVAHWPTIQWFATRHEMPPFDLNTATVHPPLYYVIAAALVSAGLGTGALGWLAALWGISRLVIVWAALERWLPESRLARIIALATAAVLPTAVHLDGMITNEALGMLFGAIVILLAPAAIAATRVGRVVPAVGLSFVLALALLTKVSASVLVICIFAAIAFEIARAPSRLGALRVRLRPLLAGALVLIAVSGWYFARNKAVSGRFAPTSYEGFQRSSQAPYEKIPYFQRRDLDFYLGWHLGIYARPFFTTGLKPRPRFFPVLIASTFNDYYVFSYWEGGKYNQDRWVSGMGVLFGCMSVVAGTAIALVTVIAWFGAVRALWRRRQHGSDEGWPDRRFALLLMPLGALLGQLHFATKYPEDNLGPIKGAYLQFVAPVMCALFGVAVAWMWRRGRVRWRVPAVAAVVALLFVAAYSIGARVPRFGPGAYTAAPFFDQMRD